MSTGHKLLIAAGVFIFVTMIAVGSFSLGVYVGEHGWTRQGLRLEGPGGPRPPAPRPGDRQPGAGQQPPPGGPQAAVPQQDPTAPDQIPAGQPVLRGVVRALSTGSILVATPQGSRTVVIARETQVERNGRPADLSDLHPGQEVAIFGDFSDGGRTLWARLVVIRRQ